MMLPDAVAAQPHVARPHVHTGLAQQVLEKIVRVGQLSPDLRQEGRTAAAALQHHAIDAGLDQRQRAVQVWAGVELHRAQHRHIQRDVRPLHQAQRREARVLGRRSPGVGAHGLTQRVLRLQLADTAAQLAVDAQGHEAGAGLVQQRVLQRLVPAWQAEEFVDGVARLTEQRAAQRLAVEIHLFRLAGRGFDKAERGIADHPRVVAGGVAGVAQVEQVRGQLAAAGAEQQRIDAGGATGLLVIEIGVQAQYVIGAIRVGQPGVAVIQIVRQVGTHHDQRLRPAPEDIQQPGNQRRLDHPEGQRDDAKILQHRLQERQLHLQRMLGAVGAIIDQHTGHLRQRGDGLDVHFHLAERRVEGLGGRQRHALEGHAMTGPEQHDTAHHLAQRRELRVAMRGDRPGIDIARMGHDQRLRRHARGNGGALQHLVQLRGELLGIGGIEKSGDSGRADALYRHGRRPREGDPSSIGSMSVQNRCGADR
ncbi:hypothetical protein D3C81_959810 [compost metagenome]